MLGMLAACRLLSVWRDFVAVLHVSCNCCYTLFIYVSLSDENTGLSCCWVRFGLLSFSAALNEIVSVLCIHRNQVLVGRWVVSPFIVSNATNSSSNDQNDDWESWCTAAGRYPLHSKAWGLAVWLVIKLLVVVLKCNLTPDLDLKSLPEWNYK